MISEAGRRAVLVSDRGNSKIDEVSVGILLQASLSFPAGNAHVGHA